MLNIIESLDNVYGELADMWLRIVGMFSDVDFTILYDWLPSDIQGVITAVIAVFIFLALIGLIKKAILFLG